MQLFKEQFWVQNKEGKACRILNEDALILEFDKKTTDCWLKLRTYHHSK